MVEPATSAGGKNGAPPAEPLYGRLSIAHLLLITAGSAVAIWLMQPPNGKAGTLEVVISAIFAPVYGTGLAILVLAFLRGRGQWLVIAEEPGHWLLLIVGGGFTGPALLYRSGSWLSQPPATPQPLEMFFIVVGICGAVFLILSVGVTLLVVLAEYHDSRRWRTVFWLLGITLITPLTCCGCMVFDNGGVYYGALVALLLASAAYAAAVDIRERQYRDLWHWLGVAALFAAVCHAALFLFVILPRR